MQRKQALSHEAYDLDELAKRPTFRIFPEMS
jgi:hypothetical protein